MIAKNISFLRKKNNLKQSEMLTLFGVKPTTWSDYERGKTTPSIDLLFSISEYFGVEIRELVKTDLQKVSFDQKENAEKTESKGKVSGKFTGKFLGKSEQNDSASPQMAKLFPKGISEESNANGNIAFVPIKARAGYLCGYGDIGFIGGLQHFTMPGFREGPYRMFEVDGDSMYPTLTHGDYVIAKRLENIADIRLYGIYVVLTREDGIVVKRLLNRVETEFKLILKSDNEGYPERNLAIEEVLEIWFCTGYVSFTIKDAPQIHHILHNVVDRLNLLEEKAKKWG